MRVLHVQRVSGLGGSERHLLDLLPALREAGVDAGMLILAADGAERFETPLRAAAVPVHVHTVSSHADPRTSARILRTARRLRPAIVHAHLIDATVHGLPAARLAGARGVVSVHSVDPSFERTPSRQAAKIAGHLADHTIAISHFVADHQVGLGLARRDTTTVIPYGIDVDRWSAPDDGPAGRSAMGFGADDLVVGMAARVVPGKGHDALLAAFTQAMRQEPRLRLALAGDGELLGEVRRSASTLPAGSVYAPGFVDDVGAFLRACDVVVVATQPELGEGFGLAALEAMATATPVIATDVAALPEVIGDAGVLVPAGSVRAMADAIVALAGDPARRRELGEAGRERARREFSLDRMVERTIEVYRRVAT